MLTCAGWGSVRRWCSSTVAACRSAAALHLAAGGATADIGQIPLAAVDRIEILKGGASAIYGSDAVAGVVNIITRKNWDRPAPRQSKARPPTRLDYKAYNLNAAYGAVSEDDARA